MVNNSKRNFLWIIPIATIFMIYFMIRPETNVTPYIDAAKATSITSSNIPINEAVEQLCTNNEWSFFETNRGQKVVEFSGQCTKDNQNVNLQFLLDDDQPVEIGALLLNGEPASSEQKQIFLQHLSQ